MLLVWILIGLAALGAFLLSRNIESKANLAAVFMGASPLHEVYLYGNKAVPASIEVRPGEEVVFVVMDESRHNMAEERKKKSDARLESGEFGTGESYSLSFQGKGTFSFYDRLNQDIRVDIVIR